MVHYEEDVMRFLPLLLLITLASCKGGKADDRTIRTDSLPVLKEFATQSLWNDGLAEVATYSSTRVVYGKPRPFESVVVTVKEDFNDQFDVKTDSYDRRDLRSMMKVNIVQRIQTDSYPYNYMTSLFFERTAPSLLHKATMSSQEWCGNTFKHLTRDSLVRYNFNSYWDGEGRGERALQSTILFEDQLFYTLRALDFQNGRTMSVQLYPTIITSKAALQEPVSATLTVGSDVLDPAALQDGSSFASTECWRVSVKCKNGPTSEYWFSKAYPHVLYRFTSDDGRSMRLRSVRRSAYWQH